MKTLVGIITGIMMLTFLFVQTDDKKVYAQTLDQVDIYTVGDGENLQDIGIKFGVSKLDMQKINDIQSDKVESGEKLIIPQTISKEEKDLLARLVHAEAKGEPYEGKVAVAQVVLNRVEDERFPNEIKDVIYEERQFQPVDNGSINKPADAEAKQAVNEALASEGQDTDAVFFFNPDLTSDQWLRSKIVTEEIGQHVFAK